MKKKIIFVMLFLITFIPNVVNAESCKVIKEDNEIVIGDEVICGTEHFYVTSNDGEKIKMLSKYLLNTGYTAHKQENVTRDNISDEAVDTLIKFNELIGADFTDVSREEIVDAILNNFADYDLDSAFVNTFTYLIEMQRSINRSVASKMDEKYGEDWYNELDEKLVSEYLQLFYEEYTNIPLVLIWKESDGSITVKWWIPSNPETVLQDSSILLPKGDKDKNWEYPINNVVPSMIYGNMQLQYLGELISYLENNSDMDYITGPYANSYSKSLISMGIPVQKVDLFQVYDFVELLENVTDGKINKENVFKLMEKDENGLSRLDLKSSIPEKYNWIYSNSYWLLSDIFTLENDEGLESEFQGYFVDRFGDFCSINTCTYVQDISMGIRPLVTMNASDVVIETPKDEVEEIPDNIEVNPDTSDNIVKYICIFILCLLATIKVSYTYKHTVKDS